MPRKQRDPLTAYVVSTMRRKVREQKYKMMDECCPGLRQMLRLQRAMNTIGTAMTPKKSRRKPSEGVMK